MSNLIPQNTFGCLNLTDIILVLNNPNCTFFAVKKVIFKMSTPLISLIMVLHSHFIRIHLS